MQHQITENGMIEAITPISKEAFAVLANCEECKKPFGVTIDPQGQNLKFVWAFKIDKAKAHRERFDRNRVSGNIIYDPYFPGCPYCHTKQFWICSCGSLNCWHGQMTATCPSCGTTGTLEFTNKFELRGGGY